MKILIRSLFLAFILTFLMSSGAQSISAAPAKKAVLVLFPYQFDLPYSVLAMQAIKDEFGSTRDLTIDMYYEYLDLNRFPGKDYQQQILSLYATKYGHKPIDLVIVVSEVVLNFWLEHRAEIAPNPPVVFCDVQTERLATRQLPPDVTGVSGVINHVKSVEWLLQTRPAVKEIVIVRGVGAMDQRDIQALTTMQEVLRGRVKFTDLSDLPLVEIQRRVAALPKSSAVVYHLMFEDVAGNHYRPIDVLRELAATSAVPVIGGYDHYIGTGMVGGYMYSIEQQARQASQMGLRILRGKPVTATPNTLKQHFAKDQGNRFIFDHLALQRYDIPLSALPSGSIIKNRQYSVWELYQPHIIAIAVAFLVLLLLSAFLIVVTRRLNTARLALSRLNADLETQVQQRTAALNQTNHNLELEITERKKAEEALKESETLYRLLIENSHDIIYTLTADGVFTFVSSAWTTLLGYPVTQVVGQSFQPFVHPDDLAACMAFLQKVIETEQRQAGVEYRVRHTDGSWRWHTSSAVPLMDEVGKVVGFEGSASDLTDRKQAEDARHHYEKLQGVLEMAGAICHEMNQPMQIISGYSEMLLKNISENDPIHTKLDMINKQIIRMGTITKKLMKIKDYETQDYAGFCRIININKSSGEDTE